MPEEVLIVWKVLKGFAEIGVVLGVPFAIWKQAKKILKEIDKKNEALRNGVQQILYFRLRRECERVVESATRTSRQTEDIIRLHDAYKALGHNGFIDEIYNRAMDVPCLQYFRKETNHEQHCLNCDDPDARNDC